MRPCAISSILFLNLFFFFFLSFSFLFFFLSNRQINAHLELSLSTCLQYLLLIYILKNDLFSHSLLPNFTFYVYYFFDSLFSPFTLKSYIQVYSSNFKITKQRHPPPLPQKNTITIARNIRMRKPNLLLPTSLPSSWVASQMPPRPGQPTRKRLPCLYTP